ncbi:MAG: type II toxin-antitoxin system ParD family antitoxin [Chromatiales bacterium]|jgi:antitoxin ParD1/3/4
MSMTRKTITITPQMDDWVRAQVESGRYGNDSEYVRDLIRRDQSRRAAELELGQMIDAAEAGGVSNRSPREIWEAAERDATRG